MASKSDEVDHINSGGEEPTSGTGDHGQPDFNGAALPLLYRQHTSRS